MSELDDSLLTPYGKLLARIEKLEQQVAQMHRLLELQNEVNKTLAGL